MDDRGRIEAELGENTNFDKEHEGELFDRIAKIEQQERAGELIAGLNRVDYVLTAALLVVFGVLPVVWHAIMYF